MPLELRPQEATKFDVVSLGECMIRLSPPDHERLEFARHLEVWVGGAEYNVSYALARLGMRTAWVGGLVANPLGSIVQNHGRAAGVDMDYVHWSPYDGVGRESRMGLNFTEVGMGVRPSTSLYDRGHSATSQLRPEDVDWTKLFHAEGARWFHTGGVFACLSRAAAETMSVAIQAAHGEQTMVSYDLNFRSKLWRSEEAIATTKPLVPYLDVLIGNEEDFQKVLGYEVEGTDENLQELPIDSYKRMVRRVAQDYPNLKWIGTTLRQVISGLLNHWSAILYDVGTDTFHIGPRFENLEIEDRVGGGDGFASGMIYSALKGDGADRAVQIGTAHGALLQSTRGDTSQISEKELLHVAGGGSARIQR